MIDVGKLTIGMVAAGGLLLSASAWSHDEPNGYADAHGVPVKTLDGCLKTPRWNAGMGIAECGDAVPEVASVIEPSPPKPKMTEVSLRGDTLFDFDKSVVKPEGLAEISRVVGDMGDLQQVDKIVVVGHTDSIGTEAYNQGLSERRANAVTSELVARGAPAEKIESYGVGETQPVASNSTREGRAQNRRVEISVRGAK